MVARRKVGRGAILKAAIGLAALAAMAGGQSQLTEYFPPSFYIPSIDCGGGGRKLPILSDREHEWHSRYLLGAAEPSLYDFSRQPSSISGALRFTWLRSFHRPVTIRIIGVETGRPQLVAKQLPGQDGDTEEIDIKLVLRALTTKQAKELRAIVAKTHVLELPPKDCRMGLDGATWLIEGVDRNGYHFVERWSPENGAVRELGLFLIALTGWRFKDVY